MGRAFEVRKKAMAQTAATKTKVYSKYGKEIYLAAKNGVPDPEMNVVLKRIIEKAKKFQVPADIVKRAIDKASSGTGEDYTSTIYEGFGPGASTLIVECLTDNVNRSVSEVRSCFTKNKSKIGVGGSVSYQYDHVSLIVLKGMTEDEVLEACLNADVDITSIDTEEDEVTIIGEIANHYAIKTALESFKQDVDIITEEITYLPQNNEYVTLSGEEKEYFDRLLVMLDEIDDVQNVYHNVALD
ncbi:MAG: YebC/PmpR family DNA-binding transcriptional regulator [Erysipelotrichales bacterium]|nr:YebC/PmpR family DNA-binding transcriptional regulator [Erysipelotrichales bacterium]